MGLVIRLYLIWLLALASGVFGTSLVFLGITEGHPVHFIYGIPVLLLGVWVTGNIWASARQIRRRHHKPS